MKNINFEFNEQELFKLNIHELRDIARSVGVASPTTLKKEELVEKTLQIVYGVAPAKSMRSAAGRPVRVKAKPSRLVYEINNSGAIKLEKNDEHTSKYVDSRANVFKVGDEGKKVASGKAEYYVDNRINEENKKTQELANSIMTYLKNKESNSASPDDLVFVSNYIQAGVRGKLLISCYVIGEKREIEYNIPDIFIKEFNLKVGDYLDCWGSTSTESVYCIDSVNGKIVIK